MPVARKSWPKDMVDDAPRHVDWASSPVSSTRAFLAPQNVANAAQLNVAR
jgi:hypothetical protein